MFNRRGCVSFGLFGLVILAGCGGEALQHPIGTLQRVGDACEAGSTIVRNAACNGRCTNSDLVCAGNRWICVEPPDGEECRRIAPDAATPSADASMTSSDGAVGDAPSASGDAGMNADTTPSASDASTPSPDASMRVIGAACWNGAGPCSQMGRWALHAESGSVVCQSAAPTPPTMADGPPHCDGIDNNCDGVVDEECQCRNDATRPCYTGNASQRGVGICRAGTQRCVGGRWSSQCEGQVMPRDREVCANGQDDDCDGVTDESNVNDRCIGTPS